MKKVLCTGVVALGIVAYSVATFAVEPGNAVMPSDQKSGLQVKVDPGGQPPSGPSADACPDVVQGLLSSAGGTIAADTTGMADDWDDSDGCGGCSYGGTVDQMIEFTVDATGLWEFSSCGASNGGVAPFDTSLQVRKAGTGCADSCCVGCDGDACGGAGGWGSTFTACLDAGQTYYLIVDGYGAGEEGPVTLDYANLGACGDPCPGLLNAGQLAAAGGNIVGDTSAATSDIENDGALCGGYGSGGQDDIIEFTVEASGTWTFDTCGTSAFDTSLMIRGLDPAACVAGCPGEWIACNGDSGCADYKSTVSATLLAGQTYYLIVDGWGSTDFGAYDVIYSRVGCTSDADCDDGLVCNGAETCDTGAGACLPGTDIACQPFEDCDEGVGGCVSAADACVNWWGGRNSVGYFWPTGDSAGARRADDTELAAGAGHELISYTFPMLGRATGTDPVGTMYTVDMELFTTEPGSCNPGVAIAGTACQFTGLLEPGGTPPDIHVCSPNGGAGTGIMIPRADAASCDIDAFIVWSVDIQGVGMGIPSQNQVIGGLAGDDDFGVSVVWTESALGAGDWGATWFGDDADVRGDVRDFQICTQEAIGACCTVIDFATDCIADLTFNDCEATTGFASWTAFAACPSDCASAGYCTSDWSTNFDWISNVTLADVNNTTADDAGGYGDYTGMTATVKVGATNQLSVTVDNAGFQSNVLAWIDWNHDFTWDDADETYDLGMTPVNGGTMTIMVTPPAGALLGATTMRVIERDTLDPAPDSCTSGAYGETEDYTVSLVTAICGDGETDSGETCDDGNTDDGDCCSSTCQLDAIDTACGDPTDTECNPADTCDATGTCQTPKLAAGDACGDQTDNDCNGADTCDGGDNCLAHLVPNGTACGSSVDSECTDPDTCDGGGNCLDNHAVDGTLCGDPATECKLDDTCAGGSCEVASFFACGVTDGCCPPGCGPRDHDLDCGDPVPTVSTWGLVILAMLLLVAMKVHFGRRRTVA